ncbi:uncharacterized protein [Rutidosis leptorrhynchoides]|uniref:uncharacterized protein n=1 Tax=Rutidosis leptorrhynchoides TaxID=125765 RepID=UPI003A99CD96
MILRRRLWESLRLHSKIVKDKPWILVGDFNATLDPGEHSAGHSKITSSMNEFRECVGDIQVDDLVKTGLVFTWNQTPGRTDGIMKKLDRAMSNEVLMSLFPSVKARFMPFLHSDHSPIIVEFGELVKPKPKPFKFYNHIAGKAEFLSLVRDVWNEPVTGYSMFSVVSKMKKLKKPIRKLNHSLGNLFENSEKLKVELENIQIEVEKNPTNGDLRKREVEILKAYNEAVKDEEVFLRQKSKVEWLNEGDRNTKYFHKAVKGRLSRSRIEVVENLNGDRFFGLEAGEQFISHFQNVLGTSKAVDDIDDPASLFTRKLTH